MPLLSSRGYVHVANTNFERTLNDGGVWTAGLAPAARPYCMDPNNELIIFRISPVGTNQLQRSTDGGATFANFGNPIPFDANSGDARILLILRSGTILVETPNAFGVGVSVMRSTDGALTWTTLTVLADALSGMGLVESLLTPGVVFITHRQNGPFFDQHAVRRSLDEGQTWALVFGPVPLTVGEGIWGGVFAATTGTLIISNTTPAGTHRIQRSTNGGASFTEVATLAGEVAYSVLNARGQQSLFAEVGPGHSANAGRLIYNGRFSSNNDGVSWAALPTPAHAAGGVGSAQTRGAVFFPSTDVAALSRSTDGGGSWSTAGQPTGVINEWDSLYTLTMPLNGGLSLQRMGFAPGRRIRPGERLGIR